MKKTIALLMVLITLFGVLAFNVSASSEDVKVYLNEKESTKVRIKLVSDEPYICIEDIFKYCGFNTTYYDGYYGYSVDVESRDDDNKYIERTLLRFEYDEDSYWDTSATGGKSYTSYTETGKNVFKVKTINYESDHKFTMIEQDSETHYVHYSDLYGILSIDLYTAPELDAAALYVNKKGPATIELYNRRGKLVNVCPIFKEAYLQIGYKTNKNDILPLREAKAVSKDGIKVSLNGALLEFDVMPTTINGRTMVPLRAIFEALSATVEWKAETQTVISTKDKTTIKLTVGSNEMYVNNKKIILDTPATEIDGRTLVPVRAVSEAFGINVGWDENNFLVVLREDKYANVKTTLLQDYYNQIIEVPDFEVASYIEEGWTAIQ